jgi:exportin-1
MEEASKLLDFNQKLDIDLLDSIVACLYNSTGEQLRLAQDILTRLKEHPDAWTRVDSILEYSQNQQTKFYALQILEEVIKTRWKILPRNQCEGKTTFFFGQFE